MPRERDPSINFNWINITTALPGAAAEDVEKQITEVLEKKIRGISDISCRVIAVVREQSRHHAAAGVCQRAYSMTTVRIRFVRA
ncbi:MAG: hypothetical protein ABW166_10920 [Sedimenticola sp.]